MKTTSANKLILLLGLLITLLLVCIVGIFFFFARLYQRDMQALTDFLASYQEYDQAIVAASTSVFAANGKNISTASEEELQAEAALSNLKTRSAVQISSVIKNEKEAMQAMQEIAELSDKEMTTLEAYRMATGQDGNRNYLEQTFHGLTKERQAAFAHFQELGQ